MSNIITSDGQPNETVSAEIVVQQSHRTDTYNVPGGVRTEQRSARSTATLLFATPLLILKPLTPAFYRGQNLRDENEVIAQLFRRHAGGLTPQCFRIARLTANSQF